MKKIFLLSAVILFTVSCGGGVQYKNASEDTGSREWGPKEIKTTVNKMVGSLYVNLKEEYKKSVFIQVKKIRNKTAEHIDTQMLANELVNNLIKKRIRFIDDTYNKDALAEMEKGMTGMIDPDSAIPTGELKSPNLYLFGEINENVRTVGGKTLQYLVVTLKVTSLSSGELIWQEQQEFLKSSKTNKISF